MATDILAVETTAVSNIVEALKLFRATRSLHHQTSQRVRRLLFLLLVQFLSDHHFRLEIVIQHIFALLPHQLENGKRKCQ